MTLIYYLVLRYYLFDSLAYKPDAEEINKSQPIEYIHTFTHIERERERERKRERERQREREKERKANK